MPRAKATAFSKILGIVIIAVAVIFGVRYLNKSGLIEKIAPSAKKGTVAVSKAGKGDVIKVGVVTWGGYAGGQYFNGGFKASKESRFYTEYGILVEFVVLDDFNASRAAWKADQVNLQWITADAFPTEAGSLAEYEPVILFQADWSRGGDAIVVRKGINTVADLKGKKISVAYGTPSHTFILWMLEAGNLTPGDVTLVEVASAIDAAAMFKSGNVDAAVVWSPDDQDCVTKVSGAKVLKSTREATNIIADVFYAKKKWAEANEQCLHGLVEGWLRGAAEINTSAEAKQKAAEILSQGLNQDVGFCLGAINNARLCTFGDNKSFFNILGCNACVSGEQLYSKMSETYMRVGLIKTPPPNWRLVTYTAILRGITLSGPSNEAEPMMTFTKATQAEASASAFAVKPVSIVFSSGSSALDGNAQYIIDKDVAPTLKAFGNSRIRVEGNTDIVGGRDMNVSLSRKRAQSAIQYLVATHGFDQNRFIAVGNGPDKPVATNETDGGRAQNRRTEFQFLN